MEQARTERAPESTARARTSPCDLSARDLAAAIAAGEISALEAVEAYVARIQEVNPRVNALCVERFAEARAEARAVDQRRARGEALGPLAGVPITVKECLDLEGTPSTFGIAALKSRLAATDELHVARLRAAGAIVLGKTNVGQLLLMFESVNPVYGRTLHPFDPERTSGGSSGGEAALLALHASTLGLGTDLCGSVRVPAAFCGVFALKPTSGRCDDPGRFSIPIGQRTLISQVGVLGRNTGDVALGLEIINGGRTPRAHRGLIPAMPLGDERAVDLSALRIGYYDDDGTFSAAPAARRAVREAVEKLAARGAKLEPFTPPATPEAFSLVLRLLSADGLAMVKRALAGGPRDALITKIEQAAGIPRLAALFLGLTGRRRMQREVIPNYVHKDADHHFQAVEATLEYRARFERETQAFDALLSPAAALPAWRNGASEEIGLGGVYTCLYNLLGWPAGVVPMTRVLASEESDRPASRDKFDQAARETERGSVGLPIGVQIAAPPWREDRVLACMHALEANVV